MNVEAGLAAVIVASKITAAAVLTCLYVIITLDVLNWIQRRYGAPAAALAAFAVIFINVATVAFFIGAYT